MTPKALRNGFTTGTCAAVAAAASARSLFTGEAAETAVAFLPDGQSVTLPVRRVCGNTFGVVKDAGDDPDITDGMLVCATVEKLAAPEGTTEFAAGEGVGRVTLPGLKIPAGDAAINPVPRHMIEKAARVYAGKAAVRITVSIPGGAEAAKKTFNPRLGVVGGLSVLGTSGIVRPMSEEALKDTLLADLQVKTAQGHTRLAFAFGNRGEELAGRALGLDRSIFVQTSNFVGFMLKSAAELGVKAVLLTGHTGKLAKVAGGSMQTHSAVSGGALEAICAHAALLGAPIGVIRELAGCVTTEAAVEVISANSLDSVWNSLAEAAAQKCRLHVHDTMAVETVVFASGGAVGKSASAALMIKELLSWEK